MTKVGKGFSGRITDLFPSMLVQNPMGEGSALRTDPQHTPIILHLSSSQPQKSQKPRKPKRKNTQVPQPSGSTEHVADETVYKELDNTLVRAATTASSLEAEQDSGYINKTQSKATPNEASSPGTTFGGSPRCQDTMRDTIAQTRVLDLEKTKTTQALEIDSLKKRVKKLEKKQRSRTHELKRLYKERIEAIGTDEDITLVNDQDDAEMFDVNNLHGEEVFVETEVADKEVSINGEANAASIATTVSATATITTEEITLAQVLMEIKTLKPKEKGIVLQDPKFQPGDHVFLKVSPARGVRRFGIKGKLSPHFIGPFEILDRVGERVQVSEEPEAILDRQDRVMRKKTIPFIKILWRNHSKREATWETEESIRTSYPYFLS
nr:hypothetical protein [Tanacetum cinerariifolium]